ncbi:MAG: acyl-CoA thioesterase II [Deltaproteobacteria bacterium]|nr:acyl-CoA thioesterase II [Deltaproteobacteria bacterium]
MTTSVLADLIARLELERIEENIFRGQSQDLGWGRVFGGQVLGQALSAAEQTVPDGRPVHSFHGYFLRPGDVARPIVFMVDPIRDGHSFTTRRVVAVQDGRAIYNMAASFQVEEPGFDHQASAMPDVPGPETLLSERELAERYLAAMPDAARAALPDALRERALADRPIEIRPVAPWPPIHATPAPPVRRVWFRASGALPDRRAIHELVLAYASDFHLLGTALQPHGIGWMTPGIQIASLDHAMWFHRPFRFDEWMLYDLDSPSAQGSRGLAHGRWFTRDGVLVATTMQEGLIRDRRSSDPTRAPRG